MTSHYMLRLIVTSHLKDAERKHREKEDYFNII